MFSWSIPLFAKGDGGWRERVRGRGEGEVEKEGRGRVSDQEGKEESNKKKPRTCIKIKGEKFK